MRSPLLSLVCLAALACFSTAQGQMSPVKIRVEQGGKFEKDKDKLTQTRTLNIFVASSAKEALDLKVKYFVFGRDLTTKEMVSIGDGELPVTIKPGTTEKVQTPMLTATSADGRGGEKRMPASGVKMLGQAVQVLKGDAIVADFYEPSNMKELVGKVSPAVVPAKP